MSDGTIEWEEGFSEGYRSRDTEIERLRYMLRRIVDEVELPQSIEQSAREALGDKP